MAGGLCTGLQSRPPAFLDILSVTVAALHVPRGLCSPSRVSGYTSHAGTR